MNWWEQDILSRRFTNLVDKVLSFRAKTGKVTARLAKEAGLNEDDGRALATVVTEELTFLVSSSKADWVSAYDSCKSCMQGKGGDTYSAYAQIGGANPEMSFAVCVLKDKNGTIVARAIVDDQGMTWSGQSYGICSHLLGSVLKFLGLSSKGNWMAGKRVGRENGDITVYIDGAGRHGSFSSGKRVPKFRVHGKSVYESYITGSTYLTVDVIEGDSYRFTSVRVEYPDGAMTMAAAGVVTGHLTAYVLDHLEEMAGKNIHISREEMGSLLTRGFAQTKFQAALPKLLSK